MALKSVKNKQAIGKIINLQNLKIGGPGDPHGDPMCCLIPIWWPYCLICRVAGKPLYCEGARPICMWKH